jgi:glycosyltransferase involved in cell wall biosynthesis
MEVTKSEIKISAILPNYNMAEFLQRSLRSLLTQTEPFYEIIVVDDGSTDDSLAVINQIKDKHPRVRLIRHEKNRGVIAALNTGLQQASGDYVMLCAADDYYGNMVVERSTTVIRRYPDVGVICGDAVVERFDLALPFYRMLPFTPNQFISAQAFRQFSCKSYVGFNGGGGMLMNRQAVVAANYLKPETRWHGDWLLYFVIAFRHGIYYVNDVFTHITMRKASYSESKRDVETQDKVMLANLHLIHAEYPDVWGAFKRAGLLPHYAVRYYKLLLTDRIARKYITIKLMWKILINNAMVVRVGRLFPYRIILGVRKLLKA